MGNTEFVVFYFLDKSLIKGEGYKTGKRVAAK